MATRNPRTSPNTALVLARTFERMRLAVLSIRPIVVWIAWLTRSVSSFTVAVTVFTSSRIALDGVPEADELPREILERRLDLQSHASPVLREEQVSGDPTDDGACDRGCHFTRLVRQFS